MSYLAEENLEPRELKQRLLNRMTQLADDAWQVHQLEFNLKVAEYISSLLPKVLKMAQDVATETSDNENQTVFFGAWHDSETTYQAVDISSVERSFE